MTSTIERDDGRTPLGRSRVRVRDLPAVATVGLRTRRVRSAMTAIGIGIGIAALVAVLGISQSARADLLAQLDELGTNRLQVQPGRTITGENADLPEHAGDRIRRVAAVDRVSSTTRLEQIVRRNDLIPETESGGIATRAVDLDLLDTIGARISDGRWHDHASARLPTAVVGSEAARQLGIDRATGQLIRIGDQWFTVIGILDEVPLYRSLDLGVFIGVPIAEQLFDAVHQPTTIYVTTDPDEVERVRDILAATTNPVAPNEVDVSNPTDALAARQAVSSTLTALLLGLGGVALLVGGIGIANVMVIGVLERRAEIGVRRALGATKGHIRSQFLLEATVLGLVGGVLGTGLGAVATAVYVRLHDGVFDMPPAAVAGGVVAAMTIGAAAGLAPAARAARLSPADAIRPA